MLRIGLIGCGGMGRSHRSAFGKLQGRARFAAAVDPILPRAQAAANLMGCDTVATDYRSILDDIDFGTWGAKGTRLKYSFHAHCTEGMLEGQIGRGRLLLHQGALEEEQGGEKLLLETAVGKHVENELLHFVDCLEHGRRPLTDGRRSLRSLRVIWKLYEAEAQGVVADLRAIGNG